MKNLALLVKYGLYKNYARLVTIARFLKVAPSHRIDSIFKAIESELERF